MQFSSNHLIVAAVALALSVGSASVSAADSDYGRSPHQGSSAQADIPLIPVKDTMSASQSSDSEKKETHPQPMKQASASARYDRHEIKVESGVNEIVKVARDHLNRIVTPFRHPQVRTTASNANTQVSESVVYVAPSSNAPVTLYITEKGDESVAVSLTLVPRRVPPRSFAVDVGGATTPVSSAKAKHWERSSDYQQSITKVLREVAKGKIPPGYSMAERPKSDPPYCYQKGVTFDFRQTLIGHDFTVSVGTLTNNTGHRIEFSENSCLYERRVAAVAAWPNVVLSPGQESEVYTVLRPVSKTIERRPERPSLIKKTARAIRPMANGRQGSFRVLLEPVDSQRIAREKVASLRSNGFAAGTYSQGDHYIVRVSGYKSRDTAKEALSTLQDMGYEHMTIKGGDL